MLALGLIKHEFEPNLKLSLPILKLLNAFQMLNLFSFFLRVTCVMFASATDVWQAIVARATESRKNCSKPP